MRSRNARKSYISVKFIWRSKVARAYQEARGFHKHYPKLDA